MREAYAQLQDRVDRLMPELPDDVERVWVRKWDLPEELRPQAPAQVEEPPLAPPAPVAPVAPAPITSDGLPDTSAETAYQLQSVAVWSEWVLEQNSKLSREQAENIVKWVLLYSQRHDVNHRLIFALIKWESWFNPSCVSRSGAIGLTQLMPGISLTSSQARSR